jgi:serine/threonine protein kinase
MPEQPTTIGRYEIIRELGGGGMGRVFLAHDPRFPRDIALKLLHADLAGETNLRRRFQREARTVAALEHYAIVPVYDYGQHEGQLFLAMRLMRGGTLQEQLAAGPLPLDKAQAILERIADALDKAHEQGIIHRDLKPANVLFDDEGNAYLSDFGIVKQAGAEATSAALTATHGVIGTPQYMSPEQALGEADIDGRSDIYALGALAYEMLCGDPPYVADTFMKLLVMHLQEPVPSLCAKRRDLPPAVDNVLAQAMAKDPQHRFASAGDFVSAFSGALRGAPTSTPTIVDGVPPTTPPPAQHEDRPYGRYAAFAAIIILAVLAALSFLGPGKEEPPVVAANPTASSTPTPTPGSSPTPSRTPTTTVTPEASVTGSPIPSPTVSNSPTPSLQFSEPQGQIVFTCYIDGWDNLCRMDADGSNQQRLTTTNATDFYASYTPDGRSILFSSLRSGEFHLYVMGALGESPQRISPDIGSMYAPHMAPDGRQIVFTNAIGDRQSVWVMNTGGGNPHALTDTAGDDKDPVWSPGGDRIAFWSDRHGVGGHYIMNADGSGLRRLPADVQEIGGRSDWSPNGDWLAFYAGPAGDHDIYLVSTDGSGELRRLTDGGNNLAPSFSPDGAWIAFTRYAGRENPDIFIMRPDGSDVQRLTESTRPDWQPRWGPSMP